MLKLKLQYFGHLMPRVDSLEKTLMLGGIGGRRRRERQRMRGLDGKVGQEVILVLEGRLEIVIDEKVIELEAWTAAHQAPPSMGFSRQEYWSGVPLPCDNKIKAGLTPPSRNSLKPDLPSHPTKT